MKRTEKAIAFVVYDRDRKKVLAVKRPEEDELAGVWGLPATSLKDGEAWEDAVIRAGKEKLGVRLEVKGMLNEGRLERQDYILYMKLYEARIAKGKPEVPQPFAGTQYVAWKWAKPEELEYAASKGSLCSRLFLGKIGMR
jgi:8-oxo-dGTP diphosphatase